jgi:SAM-dependent methyltransferase
VVIDAPSLRDAVRDAYSAAAGQPQAKHAFPVGREFAEGVGYPADLLDTLPPAAVEAFAGVSNVAQFAEIPPGCVVLDLGCGAGLDTLIAARRTGPKGKVYGVDFSAVMLERARRAAAEAGAENVELREADAERLLLPDASIDVALANGIFNLNPNRTAIFGELGRVVRPNGRVFAAELILTAPLPDAERTCSTNWFG